MKSILYEETIIDMTNQKIKYWTGITIDPNSKKFREDLIELSNIILSVEYNVGTKSKKNYIESTVNELTRKTIKNLINQLLKYKEEKQTPIMHTEIPNIPNLEHIPNSFYSVPEYIGCDETQAENLNYTQHNNIINQKVNFQEKIINYEISLEDCEYKHNNYIYNFSTPLEDITNFKVKSISLSKSDFNISNINNTFIIKQMDSSIDAEIILSEGNYESIHDIINEISTKIRNEFGNQIILDLNKITNKISFKIAPLKSTTNSTILKQSTISKQSNCSYEIKFNSDLNKILGFNNDTYILNSILEAENMYKMSYKNDVNVNIYLNGHLHILDNYKLNLKNIKFLESITENIDKEPYLIEEEMIEFIVIKLECNKQPYKIRDNEFLLKIQYTEKLN